VNENGDMGERFFVRVSLDFIHNLVLGRSDWPGGNRHSGNHSTQPKEKWSRQQLISDRYTARHLEKRYARGEITRDEFLETRQDLNG
jgi:hypothetical protein